MSHTTVRSRRGGSEVDSPVRTLGLAAVHNRRGVELLLAIVVYVGFASFLTWPVITGLGHLFYAPLPAGDAIGSMAFYRDLVAYHHDPFLPGAISQLAAPGGQTIPWARDVAAMPSVLTQYALTKAFGEIAAYDLYDFVGYVLTATAMFLFVRRLTGSAWIALICGWAVAFYPFAVVNGQGHTDYIHAWPLVVAVWRLVELQWMPSRRNAILAGLAVALSLWWTPYFILIGGVGYFAALVASVALAWHDGRLRAILPIQAVTAAIVVAFSALLASLSAVSTGASLGARTNALPEFLAYSARPLEYILPDVHSPLFGASTTSYLTSHIHGSNPAESTLYLGVTIIFLAAVAGVWMLRRKIDGRLSRTVVVLAAVAALGLITSAPPEATVFGLVIPFPSHFIMKVTTTWRAYSRFVVVIMVAFTALAGIGLYALTRGRTRAVQIAIMVAASVLIPLDLWARLPHRANSSKPPSVFVTLSHAPRGLTAEYPLVPNGENFYADVFYQAVHNMPMINGYLAGTVQEQRAVSLYNLADPQTAGRLASLGVRYVVLEAGPAPYNNPSPGTPTTGFRFIARDWFASLYKVTARPLGPALPAVDTGWTADEFSPGGTVFNWLDRRQGTIELAGGCPTCAAVLRMTVLSFARPRVITITMGDHLLAVRRIAAPTRLDVPLPPGHPTEVTITATPGPQSIAKTVGGADTRSVSIQVSDLGLVWPGGRRASS